MNRIDLSAMTGTSGSKDSPDGAPATEDTKGQKELFVAVPFSTLRALLRPGLGQALRLWLALSLRADFRSGECWPSYGKLCEDHGLSRRSVSRAIAQLEELGLLVKKRRFSRSSVYLLRGLSQFPASPPTCALTVIKGEKPALEKSVLDAAREVGIFSFGTRQLQEKLLEYVQAHGQERVLEVLKKPEARGADVLALRDLFKSNGKAARPADRSCSKCGGTGKRPNPTTGGEFACGCTSAHNPRGSL